MGTQLPMMQLSLQLGASRPQPAKESVLRALDQVEVKLGGENGSGFQLTFALSELDGDDFALVALPELAPWSRVVLSVQFVAAGVPADSVLIDGVITHHQLGFDVQSQLATLTVSGRDVGVLLDLRERDDTHVDHTPAEVVSQIVGRQEYQELRLNLDLQLPRDAQLPCWAQPRQSDLQCLLTLARRTGSVFYIDPVGPDGQRRAYFGVPVYGPPAELPLYVLAGARTNVSAMSFTLDAERPRRIEGMAWNDKGELTALPAEERIPPQALAQQQQPAKRVELVSGVFAHDSTLAQQVARATAAAAQPAAAGNVTLDTLRYGALLFPRQLVRVEGAGQSYAGPYRIESVTHTILRGSYKQELRLSREGLGG